MNLFKLWTTQGQKIGLRVRWADWSLRHKYFTIQAFDKEHNRFTGSLDCGESISYPSESMNWQVYHEGDEHNPRAS